MALLAIDLRRSATALGGIGPYGILAYSTAQRTREIGIRMALGAQRRMVVGLIVREVMLLAGGSIAVTVPLAMPWVTPGVQSALRCFHRRSEYLWRGNPDHLPGCCVCRIYSCAARGFCESGGSFACRVVPPP